MTIEEIKSKNLVLLEVISGSKAFGLDTPTSDTDIKGVFYIPKEKYFGLEYISQIANESNDIVYYELGRFVELLLKNNPNILELLASPDDCILYKNPIMDRFQISDFLSKLCKDSFAGYAMGQIKKARGLNKKIVQPVDKVRKTILDFCYILKDNYSISLKKWLEDNNFKQEKCGLVNINHAKSMYALFYDDEDNLNFKGIENKISSNDISISSVPKGMKQLAYLSFNLEGYSTYCKDYREYWVWVEKRNEERYDTNLKHGKNYDAKNMMHTIRLLESAQRIFSEEKLNVRVSNRSELLAIKSGNLEYEDLIQKANSIMENIDKLHSVSRLPLLPDIEKIKQILVSIRMELYK